MPGTVAPVHRLTKKEIQWLANHTCKAHRHNYLSHYNCFLRENPAAKKRGFLDIEATDLVANFGIMLSYCIKVDGEDKIYEGVINQKDLKTKKGDEDRRIVQKLIDDLKNFDEIVTYYGSRFDVPFIRTRAVHMGLDFPRYASLKHVDLYFVIRNRFSMRSKRLESACRVLLKESDKTRIDEIQWRLAGRGDKKALSYVVDHNRKDVTDLEKLYHRTIDFTRRNDTSI